MKASVRAVATALPEHRVSQSEARGFARAFFADDFPHIDRLLNAFDNTGIAERRVAMPLRWYSKPHAFPEKNEVYRRTALALAETAARRALAAAEIDASELGGLLLVSTTGISTPSLDSFLIQVLDLPRSVARVPIWGLGCAGGAAGLSRAAELVRGTGKPVLLVAVEVCSTTFVYGDRSKSNLIATALFGDGAAAAVLTPDDSGVEVLAGHSELLDDTEDVMGWTLRDEGLQVRFARSIPKIVTDVVPGFARAAAKAAGVEPASLHHFVLHPGGAKVLRAYEDVLGVPEARLELSWQVLRQHGNMSSPTVLFVLERFMAQEKRTGANGLLLGLGPGFSAEGALIRW